MEFRWHDRADDVFESLIEWKGLQRVRTGTVDVLLWDWVRAFARELCEIDRDGFSGVLSTLRVRGRLVAAHLGMSTPHVMHWWIPSYDPEFAHYSPGSILFLHLIKESAARGIRRVDLGKGNERYKSRFANGVTRLARGTVDLNPLRGAMRLGWFELTRWLKASPLEAPSRWPKRWAQRRLAAQRMGAYS